MAGFPWDYLSLILQKGLPAQDAARGGRLFAQYVGPGSSLRSRDLGDPSAERSHPGLQLASCRASSRRRRPGLCRGRGLGRGVRAPDRRASPEVHAALSHTLTLTPGPVALRDLVDRLDDRWRQRIQGSGVTLLASYDGPAGGAAVRDGEVVAVSPGSDGPGSFNR
jgi:hypothetical protein